MTERSRPAGGGTTLSQTAQRIEQATGAISAPRSSKGRAALLALATLVAVLVPSLTYVAAAGDGGSLVGRWESVQTKSATGGHVVSRMGCVSRLNTRALNRRLRGRFGPVIGLDNPHVITLGRRRYLWLMNDTFVDYTHRARRRTDATYLNNAAMIQRGRCFRLVHGGSRSNPRSFERGRISESLDHYFWPLGGEVRGGRIHVFWAEMVRTRDRRRGSGDGINRHPVRTWLATYDARSLVRLAFRPARNDGVFPQYGFAVASAGRYSYLFGNSNLHDLSLEGGFFDGPHSATKMYLARVRRGRFARAPEYRTARGWSNRPRKAVPFSARFWTENGMQPRFLHGHWVAVTKVDGFWGKRTIVEIARHPWGPWRIVSRRIVQPTRGFDEMNNYQPIILPYRAPSGRMIIVMSQNARNWRDAVTDFSMYGPRVYSEPWPFAR